MGMSTSMPLPPQPLHKGDSMEKARNANSLIASEYEARLRIGFEVLLNTCA
jgi:hypothetical protein